MSLRRSLESAGIRGTVSRGALGAFVVNLVGSGLVFGLHVLLSRSMGVQSYGAYVYAFTWVAMLSLASKLGLDTALIRFLPSLGVAQDWPRMRGILRRSIHLTLGATLAVGGLAALGLWLLGRGLDPDLRGALWLGCLLLPVLALTQLRQAALRGFKRVPLADLPDRILRPVLMIGLILLLVAGLGWRLGAGTAMVVHLAALAAALAVAHYWVGRALPRAAKDAAPIYETRSWLSTSLPLVITSAMHLTLSHVDILMVGSIMGSADSGVYPVSARVSAFVLFGLIAVNAIVAPMISQLYTAQRMVALQRILTLTARANLVFAITVALGIVAAGPWILSLFGTEFSAGYTALVILAGGHLVNACAGSVGFLMTMTGHERPAALIMALSVLVNVGLNASLIPIFGIEGAAVATAISFALWNILMFAFVQKRIGVYASAIPKIW